MGMMGGYPWLWGDRSSYQDAKLNAVSRWPNFLYAFMGLNGTNQEPNRAPPDWWATAGQETLQGNYASIPAAFLNSKQTQQLRNLTQLGPRDQTTQQSAALQAALAASLRAAQSNPGR